MRILPLIFAESPRCPLGPVCTWIYSHSEFDVCPFDSHYSLWLAYKNTSMTRVFVWSG